MNTKLKNLFFILVVGSLSTAVLIGTENFTQPRIERYRGLTLKTTILDTADIPYTKDDMEEVFHKNIRELTKGDFKYYMSPEGFYIFIFEDRGLWGMIEGAIALKPDLKTIKNIRIVAQEETPGLGGRISEDSFLDQFRDKEIAPRLELMLRSKAKAANEIDSITGASMTSRALIDMINKSVVNFRGIVGR